jgi:hypothetical protein
MEIISIAHEPLPYDCSRISCTAAFVMKKTLDIACFSVDIPYIVGKMTIFECFIALESGGEFKGIGFAFPKSCRADLTM